jgi:hypothetical protein
MLDDGSETSKTIDVSFRNCDRHDSGVDVSDLPNSSSCSSPFDDFSPDHIFVCLPACLLT